MKGVQLPHLNVRLKTKLILCLVLFLFTAIPFNNVSATNSTIESDSLKYSWERFSVSFGGFLTTMRNDITVGSQQLGLGINLNVEDALGLETSTLVLRGDAEYSFGKRQRSAVKFEYFGLYRSATKILDKEIEIDSITFPIGTQLSSYFNLQIFKGNYDYAFYKDDRVRLGVTIGLFVMPIRFSTVGLNVSEVKKNFTAPFPVLGLSTDFLITPKITIKQSIEFFYIQFSNFRGVLSDLNIRVEYNPWNHFGFGLGVNFYDLNISLTDESSIDLDFIGSVESRFAGLLFYGRYFF